MEQTIKKYTEEEFLIAGDTVVFDIDGVVVSQDDLYAKLLEWFPFFDPNIQDDYDLYKSACDQAKALNKPIPEVENFNKVFFEQHAMEIFSTPKPVEGVLHFIEYLQQRKINVIYATARTDTEVNRVATRRSFEALGLDFSKVVFLGNQSKALYCKQHRAKMIIEDKGETVLECTQGVTPQVPLSILVNMPYNSKFSYSERVYKVDNFSYTTLLKMFTETNWFSEL